MNSLIQFPDTHISLAHGNGGRRMRELIEKLFAQHLANDKLDIQCDAAAIKIPANIAELHITTDGYTVEPLEFPGGTIGSLAVYGTVNDLAVSGAEPLYMTLTAFIEEGLEISVLDRILHSMANACRECKIAVVAGDTKVLKRGQGGGIYFSTTGVGLRKTASNLGLKQIKTGDLIIMSGTAGDHGTAVMLAREQFGLSGTLQSDAASVLPITRILMASPGLAFMRDPTRGGIATVMHEIAHACNKTVRLLEPSIPIHDQVKAVSEILGYDPLYMANEGRVVAVVDPDYANQSLSALHAGGYADAAIIGQIEEGRKHVILETTLGGERLLEQLEDDPLPRIC
ncbi:MAG: hydrogenase expression/formation protein HypE [Methylicorpusculum sp.]|uniref:hydrogenase expression/formation protein HypE n=1 Tax=Methylicorpusculum sp. TaxID=2713644 RepID=UPI002715870F|nr:hydrogenase expression/formation protein HypE [Methylicorpusculum sp.]MDO8843144.1 hydrogenase expression/formation protein HypE [Methylicorpusculum sp.]MDO8938231.1 hydrogenase expression/formation protein HypE [Methylicorpusculum sp.]MDP2177397.1 hydrogenase expression/formation protein HypE [Methylicorpusculum sp.]MDP2202162.1 hydrogenase expression/formation protein HypE [Methylicorpusculum sp.]MDP3530153.1 hydrogenase expression/formation protein HypE [Methylicorpusculum sp.]